jgi:hypothetical protein
VDPTEQERIEASLRQRLATPKFPAIFYLPQAHEVRSAELIPPVPRSQSRCPSVARSERGLSGTRAGWGGAIREPVSCALADGHEGSHKGVSFSSSSAKVYLHWEWQEPPLGQPSPDAPEDAEFVGAAAIATFSGHVYDDANTGVEGLLPSMGPQYAEWWACAGPRFRIGAVLALFGLICFLVALLIFLDRPTWQPAVGMGVGFSLFMISAIIVGGSVADYQRRKD